MNLLDCRCGDFVAAVTGEGIMRIATVLIGFVLGTSTTVGAQDPTWRKDIQPLIAAKCGACHGANKPSYEEWDELRKKDKSLAPRMDAYTNFMDFVVWPATGAIMRRLDDGKGPAGRKPGNMYTYLGGDDAERAANLQKIKAWLGDGAWNLNRWKQRGDTPGITKEQLEKIKAKY